MANGGWRRPAGYLGLALALAAGVWSVAKHRDQLAVAIDRLDWWALALSLVVSTLGVFITSLSWRRWIAHLGPRLPVAAACRLFFVTQTGKYIPGAVWPFVAQAAAGKELGVPASTFPTATALFLYSHVATGLVAGGLALGLGGGPWWSWVLLLGGLIGMWPGWPTWLLRRMKRSDDAFQPQGLWFTHGVLFATWLCYGLAFHLLAVSMCPTPPSVFTSVGVTALSWVVGFVVIIAPAGAGPREAVLVGLLSASISAADALALALVSRVLMTIADLGLAGVFAALVPAPHPDVVQRRD